MSMKEAYLEKVRGQLAEWRSWIDQYRAAAVDQHALRVLRRLEESHQYACTQVDTLQAARGSAWEGGKIALEEALVRLKQELDESGAGRAGHYLALNASRSHTAAPFPRK